MYECTATVSRAEFHQTLITIYDTGAHEDRAVCVNLVLLRIITAENSSCLIHFSKRPRLTFNGIQGVISQELVLFISTSVKTSNPTSTLIFLETVGR
jgi:hypothetical protein